ncbi:Calcium and integrin-binding member 2 [Bulinus truncatus]|nr:Calcium and integrin-binding member 2 [Bulinus truncatus]
MGNKQSIFTDEQLDSYQDCTFFTKQDVLRIFDRFKAIDSEISSNMIGQKNYRDFTLPVDKIENIPELKENPFRRRICKVFSRDNSGNLTFEDFLNMFSVFSESAPKEVKAVYAFKVYDFDGDNSLNRSDLQQTLKALTKKSFGSNDGEDNTESALNEEEETHILNQVLKEADLDDNNELSYIEFEHVVSRAPDFLTEYVNVIKYLAVIIYEFTKYMLLNISIYNVLKVQSSKLMTYLCNKCEMYNIFRFNLNQRRLRQKLSINYLVPTLMSAKQCYRYHSDMCLIIYNLSCPCDITVYTFVVKV